MIARLVQSAATAACLLTPVLAGAAERHKVSQSGKQFSPTSIEISQGDVIVFTNDDTATHNVHAKGGSKDFNTGSMKPGDSKEVSFEAPGTTNIKCAIHPLMKMTVTVK